MYQLVLTSCHLLSGRVLPLVRAASVLPTLKTPKTRSTPSDAYIPDNYVQDTLDKQKVSNQFLLILTTITRESTGRPSGEWWPSPPDSTPTDSSLSVISACPGRRCHAVAGTPLFTSTDHATPSCVSSVRSFLL